MGQSKYTRSGSQRLGLAYILLIAFVLFSVQKAQAAPTPSYCAQSTITGTNFLLLIRNVIAHGNLADKPFIETTFGTRFTRTAQWNNPSTGQIGQIYETDHAMGNQIYLRLNENISAETQIRDNSIGSMILGGFAQFGNPRPDFVHDCFHLSMDDISAVFPGRFIDVRISDAIMVKEQSLPGAHHSTFYLNIHLDKDGLVDWIMLEQSAFLPAMPAQPLPAYCTESKLSGSEFMQAVNDIVTHGDLTDIPFLQKILRTTFQSSFGLKMDGTQDRQTVIYQATTLLGAPMQMRLVNWAKDRQAMMRQIASIGFYSKTAPSSDADFIRNCLNIHVSDFFVTYGNQFTFLGPVGMISEPRPGVNVEKGAILNQNLPGKNGSTMSLGFSVLSPWDHSVTENTPVDGVWVIQRP
ncbi:MAG: hypothetical protein KGH70_05990 [Rhodospirillales bacterium]|nr:hypothetical protein [Rhodospirillales bacterium]